MFIRLIHNVLYKTIHIQTKKFSYDDADEIINHQKFFRRLSWEPRTYWRISPLEDKNKIMNTVYLEEVNVKRRW